MTREQLERLKAALENVPANSDMAVVRPADLNALLVIAELQLGTIDRCIRALTEAPRNIIVNRAWNACHKVRNAASEAGLPSRDPVSS